MLNSTGSLLLSPDLLSCHPSGGPKEPGAFASGSTSVHLHREDRETHGLLLKELFLHLAFFKPTVCLGDPNTPAHTYFILRTMVTHGADMREFIKNIPGMMGF